VLYKLSMLKIGTLNIDWFKRKNKIGQIIIDEIIKQDFDFLIVTENITSFQFNGDYFANSTTPIPTNKEFQYLDYGKYLKGETPLRCTIFSKYKPIQPISVSDAYTCIACKYLAQNKEIIIYASIIGTWGIQHQNEIAKQELANFKTDIESILLQNENVIIAGDLNTSFIIDEKRHLPQIKSRAELLDFTNLHNINRSTENIENCIDHIFVSQKIVEASTIFTSTFLENNILNDEPHKGIILNIDFDIK
jgi:hypothetical protein